MVKNNMDIKDYLREKLRDVEPISTYKLSKYTGITWTTINTHLTRMEADGLVTSEMQDPGIGKRKRRIWSVNKNEVDNK